VGDPGEAVSAVDAASLYAAPNALAPHYSRFRVSERLLLTGHSHQAWPDRAERGQQRAFDDAAQFVDDKWERAFERAERVRAGFARLLDAPASSISLGTSTHELVVKWLSALPLRAQPRIVTTDAEFHSVRRLLQRLEQEGVQVVRVPARPAESVGERLAAAVDERAAAAIVSSVFYDSAEIAGGLAAAAARCERCGVALLVDVYHQLNVVPLSLRAAGLEGAFITGGGYKYCQLGEGNAFLRAPLDSNLRPVITGWFAEFDALGAPAGGGGVRYGSLQTRFAGATYDPTSHYRAAEVFDFFEELQLTPSLLREVSQHQVGLLRSEIDALDLPPAALQRRDVPLAQLAGFLALQAPRAAELQRELARRGVLCDARGEILRLGPAPYLSDDQLRRAVALLGEAVRALVG
jgi:kynureninase